MYKIATLPKEEKIAMTLMEFVLLPDHEKASLLYQQGVYIGKRKVANSCRVLYQLEGFYAEVIYLRYRRSISSIYCFSGTAQLDPYLSQINVGHLV